MSHLYEFKRGRYVCAACGCTKKYGIGGRAEFRMPHKRVQFAEPPCKAPTKTTKLVNHFALVVDASGSMAGLVNPVKKAFEEQKKTIADGAKRHKQISDLTLCVFSNQMGPEIDLRYVAASPHAVHLTNYVPDGMTPLFDAVAETVKRLSIIPTNRDENVSYVVMILTDGHENYSKTTAPQFMKLLRDHQATDRWSFVFMGPPGSREALEAYGIPKGNIREWEGTEAGVAAVSYAASVGSQMYYTSRSAGATKTNNFFTTDLSGLKSTDLKQKLLDISKLCKVWKVEKEAPIKDFVENKTKGNYTLGAAYYLLTKPEKIQSGKQLLIREKGRKEIYGGAELRKLLKLPGYDIPVQPGNHANYDLFVQSTSPNRKLVRGTDLIYRTDHTAASVSTW